jgi:hypothetical protein
LRLPVARAINPVTGGNWEGIGVQPDVQTPAIDALGVALHAALETISNDQALPHATRAEAGLHLEQSRT